MRIPYKKIGVVAAAVAALGAFANVPEPSGCTSDSAFVFLAPEASFFWHTATNSTMTLPVEFPDGATSATLVVTGLSYSATYAGITANEFTLSLPAADGPSDENVYGLTLTFDNGVEQSASLGLIQGLAAGAEGSTRCIAPFGGRKWRRVENRAVMPIPYGVKAFSFQVEGGDEITEPGLDGAAGWYAFRLGGGERAAVSMTDSGDVEWAASLMGRIGALLFIR